MRKTELLLPAGTKDCLRAAVSNGADAVYFGLGSFNARMNAGNITLDELPSVVRYCHERNVKAYVAMNTLVKNPEMLAFLETVMRIKEAGADAVIIQDLGLIPHIRKNAPGLSMHISTQAATSNTAAIPSDTSRVILPREASLETMKAFSKVIETEVFVHGALCFSYSGHCLFSSIVGGRSGNRGTCAQPCRKRYNGSYLMSTKDLCLLPRLPEIISTGVTSLKVEGRMRSPFYAGTVARVYRKALDSLQGGKFTYSQEDMDLLRIAFNREFTEGFAFEKRVTDARAPMNRGLFVGKVMDGVFMPMRNLLPGDGVAFWKGNERTGKALRKGLEKGKPARIGFEGDGEVYLTSSPSLAVEMGEEIPIRKAKIREAIPRYRLRLKTGRVAEEIRILVNARTKKDALEADKAGADIVYYDIMAQDYAEVEKGLKKARLFGRTQRVVDDAGLKDVASKIKMLDPEGILAGERGVLKHTGKREVHLDYSFNIFNDADMVYYGHRPIISPELSLSEIERFVSKELIVLVHGDLIIMETNEPLRCPELVDEEGRHFRVRDSGGMKEILNCKGIGLFSKALELKMIGVSDFLIDCREPGKFVRIYRKILSGEAFDDRKIRKGYTTGNMERGVR